MINKINEKMIAPCGMNCALCLHYLRAENKCAGCNTGRKVNGRPVKCGIKICEKRQNKFCYSCEQFPCDRLKRLDLRYRTKHDMSEIENLEFIRDNGMEAFLKDQQTKYQSEKGTFCVHDKSYYKEV